MAIPAAVYIRYAATPTTLCGEWTSAAAYAKYNLQLNIHAGTRV